MNGGWYSLYTGFYDSPSNNTYFYQYGGPTGLYNLNVTVVLTSFDSTAVVSANAKNAIVTSSNSDGSTSYTHLCVILPKSGINNCSYLVYIPNSASGIKWQWTLISWNAA